MRVSRVNFKPSLLRCAIAAAAAGLAQQALAVDLCTGQTTITLTGAAADASCIVDQAGATVTVPSGVTFAHPVWVQAPDASVTNVGILGESIVLAETGESLEIETGAYGLDSSEELASLSNLGTLQAGISGTVHATGESYTSTYTYMVSSSTYTGTRYYGADADFEGEARAIDLGGLGAAQISNSGTIQATVDVAVTADDGEASGYGDAQALRLRYGLAGPLTNTGTLRATANVDADYGRATAVALEVGGPAQGDISNSGRMLASASSQSDGVAAFAVGVTVDGMEDADFINSGIIEATASSAGGGIRLARGPRGGTQAAGVLIGYDGSSSARVLTSGSAEYDGLYAGATFSNSGRITAQLGEDAVQGSALGVGIGEVVSGSSFDNGATGLIEARSGANGYDFELTGLAINSVWADATASNAGLIVAQAEDSMGGAYARGADFGEVYQYGGLDNSGAILGSATATYYAYARGGEIGDLAGTADNTGTIAGTAQSRYNFAEATGLSISTLLETGRLDNDGDILARAGVQNSGYARATGLSVDILNGEISNSGTIAAELFTPDLPAPADGGPMPMVMSGGTGGEEIALRVDGGYGVINNLAGGVIDGSIRIDSYSSYSPFAIMPMTMGPGGVTLNNSGRISLSGTASSFVYGTYNQLATGSLELELSQPGVEPTGSFYADQADFSASNDIVVSVDPRGQIADGDEFIDVIYADTLVNPDGFDVTDTSLFWDFDTEETANSLSLVARYLGTSQVLGAAGDGLSPEQLALAEDLLLGNASDDFAPIVDALNRAPDAAAARDVLESIGPALSGAQGFSARGATQGALNAINARLSELRGSNSGDAFQKNAVWIKPYLGMANQDDVDGFDGYDVNTAGFILGMDGDLTDSWRVGFGVASAMTEVEGDLADLDVESLQLALYASYAINETAAIDLDINHVTNTFDSTRRIPAAGSTALGSYDGSQFAAGVTVSNRVAIGEKASFVPSAQVRFNRFMLDGYTETGAGVFNLAVQQQTETSLQWLAKAGFEFGAGPGTLAASLGAGYDTLDAAQSTASFAGGGPLYVSNGIKPESTVLTGGLGYRYVTAKNLEINAAYDAESRGSDYLAQTLSLKFRLPF